MYLANEITPETCMQKHKIIIKYMISIGSQYNILTFLTKKTILE